MDLALALHKSLGEVAQMSSAEIAAWRAYARIEAIGELRADIRNAQLLQQNVAMHVKPGTEVPKLHKFLPYYQEPPEKPKTARQLADTFLSLFQRK